jgi:hypothetical protein
MRNWSIFLFSLFFLPWLSSCGVASLLNSGTAHIKYTVSRANLEGVTYEEKDRLGNVSFSVRNVQHPKAWGKWNMNFKITPSVSIDKQRFGTLETHFNNTTGRTEQLPDIDVHRFMGFANLKITAHTPIGAFAAAGGFGGTAYRITDGAGLDSIRTREVRKLDFVYIGFFAKRFFLLMGPRYYKAGYESYTFAFRLGYFWGKMTK